jgi:hypothetical protein
MSDNMNHVSAISPSVALMGPVIISNRSVISQSRTFPFTKITYLPDEAQRVTLTPCSCVRELQGSKLEHRLSCGGFSQSLQANSSTLSRKQQGKETPIFTTATI